MQGYWNAPQLTERKISIDPVSKIRSWLHTGDLFKQDEEGYLYFVAHMDDTMVVNGERISPVEIESTTTGFHGVKETAIIAVPDKFAGNAVKAIVVASDKQIVDEKQLLIHCAAKLEPALLPKYIEFRKSLPKLDNGQIDKKRLDRQGADRRSYGDRRRMTRITLDDGTTAFIERRMNGDRRNGQDRRKMHEPH